MKKQRDTIGILDRIDSDPELKEVWDQLSEESQRIIIEIDERKRVPDMLNDAMFKGVFDPDARPAWIEKLISSVLGKDVKVIRSLKNERVRSSIHSKGKILDVVVEFEDGTIADVEIQRRGLNMPPKRSCMYSSDLVVRQYAAYEDEKLSDVDYSRVHPVHMIVIMEDSLDSLQDIGSCIHHFSQKSDTGIESGEDFELLQYYHFICLDVFQKERPHLAKSLESWLDFLTIRSVEKMMKFLANNPDFSEIYGKAKNMMYDREALLMMLQSIFDHEDIAGSINRTNESMIKILEKKVQEKDTIISMQSDSLQEKDSMLQEKDSMLQEKDSMLQEKDSRLQEKDILIEQLKRQLGEKQ